MEIKLRQRFCKDNGITLQIFQSPYFEERLELFGYLDKYKEFEKFIEIEFHNNIEEYFQYYNELKDRIIDYIKTSKTYIALNSDDMNKYPKLLNIKQGDTYKSYNIGKKFISIDMKKANFSALVHYGNMNEIPFFNSYNYKEFIMQFTPYEYFVESKYIRQVIFGNCNPKRQIHYESYLMSNLINSMIDLNLFTIEDVYSMNSDEFIIAMNDNINTQAIFDFCDKFTDFPISYQEFIVGQLVGTQAFIKKDTTTNEITFKCINPYEAPFIYRWYKNQEYMDNDALFIFEGKLAKLLEVPQISLSI